MACKYFHCVNSVTVGDSTVALGFSKTASATDKDKFCFRLTTSIPDSGALLPVYVTLNGTSVPLWNKYGNPIVGADLTTRTNYHGYYGATTPHVIVTNNPKTYNCTCSNIS